MIPWSHYPAIASDVLHFPKWSEHANCPSISKRQHPDQTLSTSSKVPSVGFFHFEAQLPGGAKWVSRTCQTLITTTTRVTTTTSTWSFCEFINLKYIGPTGIKKLSKINTEYTFVCRVRLFIHFVPAYTLWTLPFLAQLINCSLLFSDKNYPNHKT